MLCQDIFIAGIAASAPARTPGSSLIRAIAAASLASGPVRTDGSGRGWRTIPIIILNAKAKRDTGKITVLITNISSSIVKVIPFTKKPTVKKQLIRNNKASQIAFESRFQKIVKTDELIVEILAHLGFEKVLVPQSG